MKKIIFILLVSFVSVSAHAQLTNTKWKGTLQLENPADVVFDFRNDTLEVSRVADSSNLETMTYTVQDTLLTLQKIYGQSDCDSTVAGKYKFEIKDDGLYITLIEDDCDDRSSVLDNTKWIKTQ